MIDAAAARARELALTQPHTLATPILPEKTGVKLLLIGLTMVSSGQRGNAIVDLDSGLVTPYPADGFVGGGVVVQPYESGLLLAYPSTGLRFDTWQTTGPSASVSVAGQDTSLDAAGVLAGNVFWSMARNTLVPQNNVVRLVGYDVRDGHQVTDIALPESARLLGSDATNRPVVVDYGSGTYSFDIAMQQFTRITTNMAAAVRGDWRVERSCTEQLVCGAVLLHGSDSPQPVPKVDTTLFDGPMSLSPDGQTLAQISYRDGGPSVEAFDVVSGARQKLDMDGDPYLSPLSWSADGRWLFSLRSGVLSAWKVGTTDTVPLAFDGDPVRIEAYGVFPS
jgi:hypothetical protein